MNVILIQIYIVMDSLESIYFNYTWMEIKGVGLHPLLPIMGGEWNLPRLPMPMISVIITVHAKAFTFHQAELHIPCINLHVHKAAHHFYILLPSRMTLIQFLFQRRHCLHHLSGKAKVMTTREQ